jgi:hypothetical protein
LDRFRTNDGKGKGKGKGNGKGKGKSEMRGFFASLRMTRDFIGGALQGEVGAIRDARLVDGGWWVDLRADGGFRRI